MTESGLDPPQLARLFALGANDAGTPLATLTGYARTLARQLEGTDAGELAATIETSACEIRAIVERLGLVARIEEGRYTPMLVEARTDELARAVAAALGADRVHVSGHGETVLVDRAPVEDALIDCARAIMRHGAIDEVAIEVANTSISYEPVRENARPVLEGTETREFGLGASLLVLEALGSTLTLERERFVVALPKELR